jgi:hypothetical protein
MARTIGIDSMRRHDDQIHAVSDRVIHDFFGPMAVNHFLSHFQLVMSSVTNVTTITGGEKQCNVCLFLNRKYLWIWAFRLVPRIIERFFAQAYQLAKMAGCLCNFRERVSGEFLFLASSRNSSFKIPRAWLTS